MRLLGRTATALSGGALNFGRRGLFLRAREKNISDTKRQCTVEGLLARRDVTIFKMPICTDDSKNFSYGRVVEANEGVVLFCSPADNRCFLL